MRKRGNKRSKKVDARAKVYSELLKQSEAYLKLSPHERFTLARDKELWRNTPSLPLAALFKDDETVKKLILGGEAPDSSATDGVTGLMYSARFGQIDAVRLFLDAGAGVNSKDNGRGATPLTYAAENGEREIVELLLASGADPFISTSLGGTFLHSDPTPFLRQFLS